MPRASYNSLQKVTVLLSWMSRASTVHKLDSPFLYEFYMQVIKKKMRNPKFEEIELIRDRFLKDRTSIDMLDHGAGTFLKTKRRSIRSIAQTSVSSQRKCHLLYKLVDYLKPDKVLELGMSLGISSLYMAAGKAERQLTTIEGDAHLIEQFEQSRPKWAGGIKVINGLFTDVINEMSKTEVYDFIYVDGGHHSEMLLPLIESLKVHSHDQTIWLIDDIYWSKDMEESWQTLKKDSRFNVAIDLWYFGLLCSDDRQKGSVDVLIPPIDISWQMGFFR